MPFPSSPRVIFEVNPLAEVVCQLSFPSSLKIASELPAEFQEGIRQSYPLLQPQGGAGGMGVVQEGPGWRFRQGFNIGVGQQPSYLFATEDGNRTVMLTPESLAVAETRYERWENFRAEVEAVMRLVIELYEPPFFTRVGLRYKNLLDRRQLGLADAPWKDLLNPDFAGLFGGSSPVAAEVVRVGNLAEVLLPQPQGARVRLQHGTIEPPDDSQDQYAIDSDCFLVERSEAANVLSYLDGFNVHAGNLFRWAVSERLRHALKPQPVPERNAA
jgi:uncharacterized protein (TIGR04255 family)